MGKKENTPKAEEIVEDNKLLRGWLSSLGFDAKERRIATVIHKEVKKIYGETRSNILASVYSGNSLMSKNITPRIKGKDNVGNNLDAFDFNDFARKKVIEWINLDKNLSCWGRELKGKIERIKPDINVEINIESESKIIVLMRKKDGSRLIKASIEKEEDGNYKVDFFDVWEENGEKKHLETSNLMYGDKHEKLMSVDQIANILVFRFQHEDSFAFQRSEEILLNKDFLEKMKVKLSGVKISHIASNKIEFELEGKKFNLIKMQQDEDCNPISYQLLDEDSQKLLTLQIWKDLSNLDNSLGELVGKIRENL